nr:MAG TPA: hypothetical protein [Caudoviricetes sp.]
MVNLWQKHSKPLIYKRSTTPHLKFHNNLRNKKIIQYALNSCFVIFNNLRYVNNTANLW